MDRDERILVSRWAVSELWWTAAGMWLRTHDRPIGELDDGEVLRWFGDEAFRRRDAILATGADAFEPELTELLGRRVRDAVAAAGWTITADDPMNFRAERAHEMISVVPHAGRNPTLEVSSPFGTDTVSNLSVAEGKVLDCALGGAVPTSDAAS
ncbi:hypothetical protein FBY40_0857 [Microbacterium sp. SLBN-154]|uniref:hypothetical protein n=1 Tax=Microbacterium sp. SLBN-154 TaxID=2768458 RepID=UPI0011517AED|nr:hypothetical protein [Microbacterium sp. SLBN-154]TQK18370.1 hypothetical protein FBY40_0857 [Microbacterium sp. SLBN-154]